MTEKILAKADFDRLEDPYRSKIERLWSLIGPALLEAEYGYDVALTFYEPVSWYWAGNRYKPDFMHIAEDGTMIFVEVKASKKQRGYRDARSKLRAVSSTYPFFVWVEARHNKGNWELEKING